MASSTESEDVDLYACEIRAKNQFFNSWKTGGYIPRKISPHVYYFISREDGFVNDSVISTKYRPLLIPSGGLKIPLLLKLSCPEQKTFEKMNNFVDCLYDYDYSGLRRRKQ